MQSLAVALALWLVLLYATAVKWDEFVRATGDTLGECNRGTCGALGEFSDDHPGALFLLFAIGTAIPAALIARLVHYRLLSRYSSSPEGDRSIGLKRLR